MDSATLTLAKSYTREYVDDFIGAQGHILQYMHAGEVLPATRSGGANLVEGDFVRPYATETFPFSVYTDSTHTTSIEFENRNSIITWTGASWLPDAHSFQKSNEVALNNSATESLSGTALYQSEVNAEFKSAIQKRHFVFEQSSAAAVWNIAHNMAAYPCVTVLDSAGNTCIGKIEYIDTNNIKLTFNAAFSGKAYLS